MVKFQYPPNKYALGVNSWKCKYTLLMSSIKILNHRKLLCSQFQTFSTNDLFLKKNNFQFFVVTTT